MPERSKSDLARAELKGRANRRDLADRLVPARGRVEVGGLGAPWSWSWAKAQAKWRYDEDGMARVSVRFCDDHLGEGADPESEAVDVLLWHGPAEDPNVRQDQVLPIVRSAGEWFAAQDTGDRRIGDTILASLAPESGESLEDCVLRTRPGWRLCLGEANGTTDWRGLVPAGVWPGGVPGGQLEKGAEGDYAEQGHLVGHTWHGQTENNHPAHVDHDHHLYLKGFVPELAQQGDTYYTIDTALPPASGKGIGPEEAVGTEDEINLEHAGPCNTWDEGQHPSKDTDNRPRTRVAAFIERAD